LIGSRLHDRRSSVQIGPNIDLASGKPGFRTFVLAGFIALLTIVAFITGNSRTVAPPENAAGLVVVFIFFASLLFLKITRQWTAEIDLDTRRLRIFRVFFGRWRRDMVDCSLDECAALGMIEYDNDGHFSYGVYVRLKSGARHAIPLPSFTFMGPSTFSEAASVASQLSAATGIPRLDAWSSQAK
jgi:hypothetical protein